MLHAPQANSNTPSSTGLVLDTCFMEHRTRTGHPERPERILHIAHALEEAGLAAACRRIPVQAADLKWILNNHSRQYVERLAAACESGQVWIDCQDSSISPQSYDVALKAAGSVLAAVDLVMAQKLHNAFCAVRPPGHHAEQDRSLGFCLFNNVAVAARYLLEAYHLNRVLILDWDVHHGNGTQHSFEREPRVFFCSLHEDPRVQYPGTGFASERGIGNILNIPLPPGTDHTSFMKAFEDTFLPAAYQFNPEFVLVSAGFDAHQDDLLGHFKLESESYARLTQLTLALARTCAQGRLVSILEGGYQLEALAESVALHVSELSGRPKQRGFLRRWFQHKHAER